MRPCIVKENVNESKDMKANAESLGLREDNT
jgi:hypothetical protein